MTQEEERKHRQGKQTLMTPDHIIDISKRYGIKCHVATNHMYDVHPYAYHLNFVFQIARTFQDLIPAESRYDVLASCWVHDCIEDCRQTYNDVKHATNEKVADLAYALTNEKGKSRKQRANDKYYQGIRETEFATFVKLCDRIANVQHSVWTKSKMVDAYRKENGEFMKAMYDERYGWMLNLLCGALEGRGLEPDWLDTRNRFNLEWTDDSKSDVRVVEDPNAKFVVSHDPIETTQSIIEGAWKTNGGTVEKHGDVMIFTTSRRHKGGV